MRRRLAIGMPLILLSSGAFGDAPLPPRPELAGIKTAYLDVTVLVGEHGQPGLLHTPAMAERLRPSVATVLTEAGISLSVNKPGLLPQFRLRVQVIRNSANPGWVSIGVEVMVTDIVRLERQPKVVPMEQACLWSSNSVDLIPEGEVHSYLASEATRVARSFLDAVRYAQNGKLTDALK